MYHLSEICFHSKLFCNKLLVTIRWCSRRNHDKPLQKMSVWRYILCAHFTGFFTKLCDRWYGGERFIHCAEKKFSKWIPTFFQKNDKENIIIWWTPFLGNIEYTRTCGSTRCLFTENRHLLDHSNFKVSSDFALIRLRMSLSQRSEFYQLFESELLIHLSLRTSFVE